jgi:type II secretory pathway pseudopilin PulG
MRDDMMIGMRAVRYQTTEILAVAIIAAAIVGLLLYFVFAIRPASRDNQRIADVQSIQRMIALYASGGGIYPLATATTTLTGLDPISQGLIAASGLSSNEFPRDPLSPRYEYTYISNDRGNDYQISFCLETDAIAHYTRGCRNVIHP